MDVNRRRPTAAVIGPGDTDDPSLLAAAEQIAAGLAEAGVVVVCGGLGGVMAAAARGARRGGGTVIGVLPGTDAADASPDIDVVLPTGLGQGRNLVVARADVVVAVGGSWGTLAEIALARRAGRPVVSCGGWQVLGPAEVGIDIAATPAGAVVRALAHLGHSDTPKGTNRTS